jgi:hypothetical protein
VLTLRQSAELLSAAHTPDGLVAVAALLGFADGANALDADACSRLGLSNALEDVRVIRGAGALRALLDGDARRRRRTYSGS